MSISLEFKEPMEVTTAKGDGYIWYMMDYGPHFDTLYTVILKESGECWQMTHKDFRIKTNTTLGIVQTYEKPEEQGESNIKSYKKAKH